MIRTLSLLVLGLATALTADRFGIATVTMRSNGQVFSNVIVFNEDAAKLEHSVDAKDDGGRTTKNAGEYTIVYNPPTGGAIQSWYRANGALTARKPAEAAELFAAAVGELREADQAHWAIESAFRAARLYIDLKEYDKAISQYMVVESGWPKALRVGEARFLRGQALIAKGDAAGARKLFGEMAGQSGASGIFGVRGLSDLLRAEGKPEEAAKIIVPVLARVRPEADPDTWGTLAVQAITDLANGKQVAEAQALAQRAILAPIPAAHQAGARVQLGKLRAAQGDAVGLQDAVDHFAIARGLSGSPEAVRAEAAKLGREAIGRIEALPGLDEALKRDYRLQADAFGR